jgi:hypothetical protein
MLTFVLAKNYQSKQNGNEPALLPSDDPRDLSNSHIPLIQLDHLDT